MTALMMMMMMMMTMMNCFCGMVERRKAFSLISSRDRYQRSSPSQISDTPWAGFEPAQNLSSGLVGWTCVVVTTPTPLFSIIITMFYLIIHWHYSLLHQDLCIIYFIYTAINGEQFLSVTPLLLSSAYFAV